MTDTTEALRALDALNELLAMLPGSLGAKECAETIRAALTAPAPPYAPILDANIPYHAHPHPDWRAVADGLAEAVRELKALLFSEKVNYGKLSPETFAAIYEIKIADAALAAHAAAKEAG